MKKSVPVCPSAQPGMKDSVIFAIVGGTAKEPRVKYLPAPRPATKDLVKLAGPMHPTEVFRFAAPCAGSACRHYDGSACQLAARAAAKLEVAVQSLPSCPLRPKCRWWLQEGKSACLRCPQIATTVYAPSELLQRVAAPTR